MDRGCCRRTSGKEDLLYVSEGAGYYNAYARVDVYRYWKHTLVGVLKGFEQPTGECTDAAGDVYVADISDAKVVEYAHGDATPLHTISTSPHRPVGCAVNLKNGDLAIANWSTRTNTGDAGQGNVAIYTHAEGKPKIYENSALYFVNAYDVSGDLFAAGETVSSPYTNGAFAYLAYQSKSFQQIDIPPPSGTYNWSGVVSVGWDGKY
jgi:hypothetical protein